MNALISGQAGVAVIVQGDDVSLIRAEDPTIVHQVAPSSVWTILAGASDVIEIRNVSQNDIGKRLKDEHRCDRALHLVLIVLDGNVDAGIRSDAARHVDPLLADETVRSFVRNRLFSHPMPTSADVDGAKSIAAKRCNILVELIDEVMGYQDGIRRVSEAFSRLPPTIFSTDGERARFHEYTRRTVVWRLLAIQTGPVSGPLIVEIHSLLRGAKNARAVVTEWVRVLGVVRSERTEMEPDEPEETAGRLRMPRRRNHGGRAAFENAIQQKDAIKREIARGQTELARKFANDLMESQTADGRDPQYASKSLCDLSQHAKRFSNYSLQLEFAELAASVCPDDGWAHSQVADAFICLGRLDDARRSLDNARERGEAAYANHGYARILRLQGKFEESLEAFTETTRSFPDKPYAWSGRAEVLRDMWRLEDSLLAYNEAVEKFPRDLAILSGRANVLKELGRHSKALAEYDIVIQLADDDDPVGRDGRADVLFEMGRFEAAFTQYQENIRRLPGDSVAHCGAAEALLALEREADALEMYRTANGLFPHLSAPAGGLANALVTVGRLAEAERAYAQAIERFPKEIIIRNGYANLLKKRGRFDDSLREYDEIARDNPFDLVSRTARADLLKQLGRLDDAVAAYRDLLATTPRSKRLRNSLAAVYVARGEYQLAEPLLSAGAPDTMDDWIGYHVRGMLLMRKGELAAATKVFRHGSAACPWYRERPYFRSALAICLIRQEKLRDAAGALMYRPGPVEYVLRIHAMGKIGDRRQASNAYLRIKDYCPPLLVPLRDELANRYVLNRGSRQSDKWLFDQEVKSVLLRAA